MLATWVCSRASQAQETQLSNALWLQRLDLHCAERSVQHTFDHRVSIGMLHFRFENRRDVPSSTQRWETEWKATCWHQYCFHVDQKPTYKDVSKHTHRAFITQLLCTQWISWTHKNKCMVTVFRIEFLSHAFVNGLLTLFRFIMRRSNWAFNASERACEAQRCCVDRNRTDLLRAVNVKFVKFAAAIFKLFWFLKISNIIYFFCFLNIAIFFTFWRLVKKCRSPNNRSLQILLILAPRGVPPIRGSFLIDFINKLIRKGGPHEEPKSLIFVMNG